MLTVAQQIQKEIGAGGELTLSPVTRYGMKTLRLAQKGLSVESLVREDMPRRELRRLLEDMTRAIQ